MEQDNTRFHMFYGGLIALLVLFVVVLLALLSARMSPAHAQQQHMCKPIREMQSILAERYHEHEIGAGILNGTRIFVLYTSEGGKTWTLLEIGTSGMACAVASGVDWTAADRGV